MQALAASANDITILIGTTIHHPVVIKVAIGTAHPRRAGAGGEGLFCGKSVTIEAASL
jgi:hypothetical protein